MDILAYLMQLISTAMLQALRQPPPENRALVTGFTLLLLCVALWGLAMAGAALIRKPGYFSGRTGLRLVSWIGVGVSAGVMVLVVIAVSEGDWEAARIVEVVVPLALGLQAALLFSPDDEAGLEVLLACPRGIAWLVLERLGLIAAAQGVIAFAGMAVSLALLPDQAPLVMLARWLPPAVLLSGLGMLITVRSRSLILGVLTTGLVGMGLLVFAQFLLPGMLELPEPLNHIHAYLWAISPYLQPDDLGMEYYALNRLCVLALGAAMLTWSIWALRDEETVLLGRTAKRRAAMPYLPWFRRAHSFEISPTDKQSAFHQ